MTPKELQSICFEGMTEIRKFCAAVECDREKIVQMTNLLHKTFIKQPCVSALLRKRRYEHRICPSCRGSKISKRRWDLGEKICAACHGPRVTKAFSNRIQCDQEGCTILLRLPSIARGDTTCYLCKAAKGMIEARKKFYQKLAS